MTSTDTSEQHHCQRPGCKGILRSPESIARGMSERCDRRVRQAEAVIGAAFKPEQVEKAHAAIRSGQVTVEGPGLYGIPSSKNDGTRYATDGASCCCPAGAHDRKCWHLIIPIVADLSRSSLAKAA